MTFSVAQIRILIVVLNLGVTVLIGGQTYYGLFKVPEIPALDSSIQIPAGDSSGKHTGPSLVPRVSGIGAKLMPREPPPPPPPPVDSRGDEELPADDGDELLPGPLDEGWEFVHVIEFPDNHLMNRATLYKKSNVPVRGKTSSRLPTGASASSRVIRSSSSSSRTRTISSRSRVTVPTTENRVNLQERESWEVPGGEVTIMVISISRFSFKYEDKDQPGRLFELTKKKNNIYGDHNGKVALKMGDDPEDGEKDAEESDDEKPKFLYRPPDRFEEFRRWMDGRGDSLSSSKKGSKSSRSSPNAPGSSAGTVSSLTGNPGGTVSPRREVRPMTREEGIQEMNATMDKLKDNKKFQDALLKASPEDRKLLEGLKGLK